MPASMLADATPFPVVSVRDLERATAFYTEVLGLRVESAHEQVAFLSGGGGRVLLSLNPEGDVPAFTIAGWLVPNAKACVAALAARGVEIETFGLPHEEGIITFGTDQVVYFRDSEGNLLSATQRAA